MDTQQADSQAAARHIIDALRLSAFGYGQVVVPEVPGLDWARVVADSRIPLVVTNRPCKALRLCEQGQPAIAIMGTSKKAVAKWLRDRGANVITNAEMH